MLELLRKINNETELDKNKSQTEQLIKELNEIEIDYSDILDFYIEFECCEYFLHNLTILEKESAGNVDIKKKIKKIRSHIKLEEHRKVAYEEKFEKKISAKYFDSEKKINDFEQEFEKTKKTFNYIKRQISNWYTNIITIIGIFSAIVITFFGGISSITSIFNNINSISKYRLLFVLLVVTFAMFNIIFMLLHYIAIISGRTINKECYIDCETYNKNNNLKREDGKCLATREIKCIRKRYPMVFYFNFVILTMLVAICICYFLQFQI